MPDQMKESIRKGTRRNRAYFKSEFRYDQERDCYICPEGESLPCSASGENGISID